jgi:hypothetical protein
MEDGGDRVVAADLTERRQRPTLSLCNGVKAAQNIALRVHKGRGHVARGCRQIPRLYTGQEHAVYFVCPLPGTRRDQFRSVQDDVGQLVVVVCTVRHALADQPLNPSY